MNPPDKNSTDHKWLGAAFITLVLAGLAVLDQVRSGSVDTWLIVALIICFAGWLGESVTELLKSWRG